MIPTAQLEKRALAIKNDVDKARLYVDGTEQEGVIKRITLNGSTVKVFVAFSELQGHIERVELYDKGGDLLQVQDFDIVKDDHYKFLCVMEIKVEGRALYG